MREQKNENRKSQRRVATIVTRSRFLRRFRSHLTRLKNRLQMPAWEHKCPALWPLYSLALRTSIMDPNHRRGGGPFNAGKWFSFLCCAAFYKGRAARERERERETWALNSEGQRQQMLKGSEGPTVCLLTPLIGRENLRWNAQLLSLRFFRAFHHMDGFFSSPLSFSNSSKFKFFFASLSLEE